MLKSLFRFFFGKKRTTKINLKDIVTDIKNTILLDVRTASEYQHSHASNSINIDVRNMNREKDFFLKNKNKNFVVFCQSGMRSYKAVGYLKKLGLTKVYNGKTVHRIQSMQ